MVSGKLFRSRASKNSTNKKQNKQIKKNKEDLKKVLKSIETKYHDSKISQALSTAATMTPLLNVPVVTGANDLSAIARSGNSINVLSWSFNGLIQMQNSAITPNDATNRVRIIVVHSPDSSTPTAENIMAELAYDINSHYRIKPEFNYNILYNKVFNMSNAIQVQGTNFNTFPNFGSSQIPIKIRLKKKEFSKSGTKASWTQIGATSAVAPQRGALTMLAYSDSGAPTHPTIIGRARLRFDDTA